MLKKRTVRVKLKLCGWKMNCAGEKWSVRVKTYFFNLCQSFPILMYFFYCRNACKNILGTVWNFKNRRNIKYWLSNVKKTYCAGEKNLWIFFLWKVISKIFWETSFFKVKFSTFPTIPKRWKKKKLKKEKSFGFDSFYFFNFFFLAFLNSPFFHVFF